MTNGVHGLHVNVGITEDVLYMGCMSMSCTCASIIISFVKWNLRFFVVVENVMTLFPNEREVQLKFCVNLFGHVRRHSVFYRSAVIFF